MENVEFWPEMFMLFWPAFGTRIYKYICVCVYGVRILRILFSKETLCAMFKV